MIEEPELGAALVADDSLTCSLQYRWETGWSARIATRASGSSRWREVTYSGRDEAELHALVSDRLAEALGLL